MIKLTKYIHVFPFHYLVMVIFLLTYAYLENTFNFKMMSNTMCNALSIHVIDMHSCTGISLQWNHWQHLLGEYFVYSTGNGMPSKMK